MKNNLEDFLRQRREELDDKLPPPEVLGRVLLRVQPKEKPRQKGILIPFRVVKLAAAAVLLFAFAFAYLRLKEKPVVTPKSDKLQVNIARTPPAKPTNMEAVDKELAVRKEALSASLQEKDPHDKRDVMFTRLNDMQSPATRISAAYQAGELKNVANDVVDALAETLNTDPNANVRLAALDGLAHFYGESYVRIKLIAALKKQQDPLVEIALINLLTRMKESAILSVLERMVHDDNTQAPVKDCAYSGIMQLQSS